MSEAKPTAAAEPESSASEPPTASAPAASTPDGDASTEAKGEEKANGPAAEAKGETPAAAEATEPPKPAKAKDQDGGGGPPLVRKGNPLRKLRGGITAGIGALFTLLLMAHDGQLRLGVPLGFIGACIAAWGVMDLLGTFDDGDERLVSKTSWDALFPSLASLGATFLVFCLALGAAAASWVLPQVAWGIVVTLAFIAVAASIFELGVKVGFFATDETGAARPLFRRHGFWVIAASSALYFPFMGIFSLWDPWETHYGEVAREMLARDDWISLWWAQDGWFWSKPILDFWMQGLAMATLGLHYKPDQMLVGSDPSSHLANLHPEWIVRAPVVMLTIVGMYALYKGTAKAFGRRAGLLGALVLATMPDWWFLAHQTMTDMPFVASMTAAMGMLMLGLRTEPELEARVYQVGKWRLTAWHLVFGAILLCVIPQVLYLLSRNVELVLHGHGPHGIRPHLDEFRSGSGGGNCGLPGNEACAAAHPASIPKGVPLEPHSAKEWFGRTILSFEPFVQAIIWSVVCGALLYLNWGERRLKRLFYVAGWFFAALATMGKGPAGFGLPMLCGFVYLWARGGKTILERIKSVIEELTRLEILSGVLVILCVALPWFVAMYVRHGSPFTDRLIFHDMFNRAFHHVHDTNEGDDTSFRFYIWQLGYALFPWTGLAPLGLLWWTRRPDQAGKQGQGDMSVLLVMWFLFAFALFSFMGTKFHHYIFPAVPPVGMLVGVALDDMMGKRAPATGRSLVLYLAGLFVGTGLCVIGATRFFPGAMLGTVVGDKFEPPPSSPILGGFLFLLGAGIAIATVRVFRATKEEEAPAPVVAAPAEPGEGANPYRDVHAKAQAEPVTPEKEARRTHESLLFGAAAVAGALALVLVGRDLALKPDKPEPPGAIRLLQLFTYNYKRPWPDTLDFGAVLTAFALVAVILSLLLAWRAGRRHLVPAFTAFAFVWALWGLDVYMVKTAPHWGQHEVIEAYYRTRASPNELLVAYQMNWKGENFYTGNHVPAFVSTGATFTSWLKKERESGAKVMFFVTEHNRVGGLKSEVGGKRYEEITDKALCNKFVLVRAEL